jgi:hypothetical protein
MTRKAVADRLELQVLHRDGVLTTGLCECVLSGDNQCYVEKHATKKQTSSGRNLRAVAITKPFASA